MEPNLQRIEDQALKLSLQARAALAQRLLLSLDAPSDVENLQLWVREAEWRLKELRKGSATGVPAEEVFRRARAILS